MKPPIKWIGGKTQLLPELRKRIPTALKRYYEPFVGGGALFFSYDDFPPNATLGDANVDLMELYGCLRDMPSHLIVALQKFANRYNNQGRQEAIYYAERTLFNATVDGPVERSARFIFLNKTGFNGLYRVNKKGELNVPWGKHASFTPDEAGLMSCSRALKNTTLVDGDFEDTVNGAERGDFAYFDPPYVPASASANFAAYQKEGFGPDEQERLRDCALRLKKRGVSVLLSNSDTPLVRQLYERGSFNIESVMARRAVNSDGAKRGKVGEVLIS